MVGARSSAIFALVALNSMPVAAETFNARLFGHQIAIVRNDEGEGLEVDGRSVLKNYYVSIDEIGVAGGVPVAIGTSSFGGNACDGSTFILSFPPDDAPRVDGPVDDCVWMVASFVSDGLELTTGAGPGSPGERWSWTLADGLQLVGSIEFEPDTSRGWTQLRERTAGHPSDLFNYAEVAAEIEALAGADLPLVQRILTGVGIAEFEGDWFIGSSCTRHMCTVEEGLVAASLADREVYVAWKPAEESIVVRPPVSEWPERPRLALREWASKWP